MPESYMQGCMRGIASSAALIGLTLGSAYCSKQTSYHFVGDAPDRSVNREACGIVGGCVGFFVWGGFISCVMFNQEAKRRRRDSSLSDRV